MKGHYYELYEVLPNLKRRLVSGKNQFGDLDHAKKAAQKRRKEKITWRHMDDPNSSRPTSTFRGSVAGKLKFEIKRRSKNPVAKKKRSAKQKANDKRLGRMAKARAKAARKKTKRKTTKRKYNPRKKVAKSHLQLVFRCRGSSVMWLTMDTKGKWNWTSDKGKAIRFKTQSQAGSVAKGIARKSGYAKYQLGACNAMTSAAKIKASCSK